jgi:hypothetical protein
VHDKTAPRGAQEGNVDPFYCVLAKKFSKGNLRFRVSQVRSVR